MNKKREQGKNGRSRKPQKSGGDLAFSGPRPSGRGIFLASHWCFKDGKLSLRYSKVTNRNRWRFLRNHRQFRKTRIPHHFARHGERGENRTNNCESKTRHGSAAACRYIKFASPDICYENFYYLKFSDHGGGTPGNLIYGVSCEGRVVYDYFSLDALHRGIFLAKDVLTTQQTKPYRRHNVSIR